MADVLVKNVMSAKPVWINESDTLQSAAQKMANFNVGALPVTDAQNNLIGIVTDRDIVVRACAHNWNMSTAIAQVMSTNVALCSSDWSVQQAAELMAQRQIRRLPVVDNGQLVGMVALADLALHLQDQPQLIENILMRISKAAPAKAA